MQKYSLILFLSLISILGVEGQQKLGFEGCQLCMQTYKINCTICYDRCSDAKTLSSCTYSQCTSKDASGNCVVYANQTLNSGNCLSKCCNGFNTVTAFTQPNFNLCIQRDAAMPNNINIGLTLGLILTLLVLLFIIGLGFLLALIFCVDKDKQQNQKQKNAQYLSAPIKSAQGMQRTDLKSQRKDIKNDGGWVASGAMMIGNCQICHQRYSNVVGNCGHQYHYVCLCRNAALTVNSSCPLCRIPSSLANPRIYCSNCATRCRNLDLKNQPLDINFVNKYSNITCNKCS